MWRFIILDDDRVGYGDGGQEGPVSGRGKGRAGNRVVTRNGKRGFIEQRGKNFKFRPITAAESRRRNQLRAKLAKAAKARKKKKKKK